jgi:HEAT repeats
MLKNLKVFILSFLLFSTAMAQQGTAGSDCDTSALYGQVLSSVKIPPSDVWLVEVTAKNFANKEFIKRELSNGEWYCIKVPTPLTVYLIFQAPGYKAQRSDPIDTGEASRSHSWPLQGITLHHLEVGYLTQPQGETVAQRNDQGVRDQLEIYKETISPSDPNDVFIWNVELYRYIYRNDPDVTNQINKFVSELKADPQYSRLMDDEYTRKASLFQFVIARNQGLRDNHNVSPTELVSIVSNPSISSSIRANTIRALATLSNFQFNEKKQVISALIVALEQDSSVPVRIRAAEALGALGDQPDILSALRRAAENDASPEVKSSAKAAAELVARRPTGEHSSLANTEIVSTSTQAIQNPDGTWTVVQYPTGKEVVVDFTPGRTYVNAHGRARIVHMADGTKIALDLSGLPADATAMNLYAVDPFGKVTMLGPVTFTNGVATQTYMTPLDRFMLVLSPDDDLTTYNPYTAYAFRSAVPAGYAVVPLTSAAGEKVAATTTAGATTAFTAPMLNIPSFHRGSDTEVKTRLAGMMSGARVNFTITPRKDGPTEVVARFHEFKEAPAGQVYVLWAVSPEGKYTKLGQVVNTGNRNEAEIKSETALSDFGLLVTLQPAGEVPAGDVVVTGILR